MADGEVRVKSTVDTTEWKELQKEIVKAENRLGTLKERQAKYDATGVKKSSASYKNLAYDIKMADQRLSELIMEEKQFSAALDDVEDASAWQKMVALARRSMSSIPQILKESVGNGMKKATDTGKSAIKNLGKAILKSPVTALKKFGSVATGAFKKVISNAKKSNGMMSTFASRLKGISLSLLVFNWISKGFNAMVAGMKEGFQNLAGYSDEFNDSMSDLKSSTNQLKNGMAAAFAPVVQMILPYLTQLVNKLNSAAESMSRFLATMSGKSTYTRAVKQTEDYAASLDKTGKAADKAKGSLAGFDDLNVIGNNSSDSSGSGDSSTMFEEMEIGQSTDFAQGMKDAIDAGDWEGCGALLAQKVNSMMQKVDFSTLQTKSQDVIRNFTSGLNGFIQEFDWGALGSNIGNGLNTIIYSAKIFVTTADWKGIGTGIYTGLNSAVKTIDWASIGQSFSGGVRGLLGTLKTIILGTDWTAVGEAFGTALANVDWIGIMQDVWGILTGAVEGLWDILIGLFRGLGMDGVAGFLEGMKQKLKNIGKWIKEKMINPLVNKVKEFLGIHSPSTVFSDIGKNVVTGMYNGLKGAWSTITSFFTRSINNLVNSIKNNRLSVAWKNLWNGMSDTFKGIINAIPTTLESVINKAIDLLNKLISGANGIISKIPGNSIGTIPTISHVSIPKLADGAVIPPNSEFLAILGDQKSGTNIEAPLETIVDALKQALAEFGINVDVHIEQNEDGTFRIVQKAARRYTNRTGRPAFPM